MVRCWHAESRRVSLWPIDCDIASAGSCRSLAGCGNRPAVAWSDHAVKDRTSRTEGTDNTPDRRSALHLSQDRRSPHSAHLQQDRRLNARRRRSVGHTTHCRAVTGCPSSHPGSGLAASIITVPRNGCAEGKVDVAVTPVPGAGANRTGTHRVKSRHYCATSCLDFGSCAIVSSSRLRWALTSSEGRTPIHWLSEMSA